MCARAISFTQPLDQSCESYAEKNVTSSGVSLRIGLLSPTLQAVVQKVLDIALEDGHPGQMAALKLCMERALPVSMFEKTAAQRAAVTINITGIGGPDAPAPQAEIIDVQMKDANG